MVEELHWDSEFFGLSIGRIDISTTEEWDALHSQEYELRGQFDLIYIFAPCELLLNDGYVKLVDVKTIYSKSINSKALLSSEVDSYSDVTPNEDLCRLALISGGHSRFRLDNRFPAQSYERMYLRWIEQSVNRTMADAVFVHRSDEQIDGMITVKKDKMVAHVGLVAVDELVQGRGVGSKLLEATEAFLKDSDIQILKVATQWENKAACRLYEKNGFEVESKTNIYHWWL